MSALNAQAVDVVMDPTKRSVSIRETSFDDYSQIRLLESQYGLEPKSQEEWQHLWTGNPAMRCRPHWPIGWVCERNDGSIVGTIGNIPLLYEYGGSALTAAATRAWVVDSAHRSYSISLLSRFFGQRDVDIILNTTAGESAQGAQAIFRAKRVPLGTWDESLFWITHYPGFAASLLAKWGLPHGWVYAYPVALALRLNNRLHGRGAGRSCAGQIQFESCFDDRFEYFWQQLRAANPNRLLAVRSLEVLQWHFSYALRHNLLWIVTSSRGSEINAYALFYEQDNSKFGLKRMRLIDYQSLTGTDSLLPMMTATMQRCHSESIHMLEVVGATPQLRSCLMTLNARLRKLPSWLYFYRANHKQLAAELQRCEAWNPSAYDGDSSL